jgi:hypothetical protein
MILTADEICKAVGARAASERWLKDAQAIESALLEKLRAGVELPEPFAHAAYEEHPSYEGVGDIVYYHPNAKPANCIDLFTRNQVNTLLAARALAGREQAIEDCATAAWTHYMDTAKRKGIGPDVMPEWIACKAIRALAASLQEPTIAVPVVEQFLQDGDQHLLHSFIETTEDDEGYMLTKPEIKRLAELGVVQSHGFGKYSVTMFGHWVHERYWHQNPSLPLKTNTDRTADAAIAAGQQYLKENGK